MTELTENVSSPKTNVVSSKKQAAPGPCLTEKEKNDCDWKGKKS
jgi:hypothetical protein